MDVPVLVAKKRSRGKHPIFEYKGIRYYRKPPWGYYKSSHPYGNKYLHRVVWEDHHGLIPDGCAIHHADHTPANNHISNLRMLSCSDHARYHMADPSRIEIATRNIQSAIKGAAKKRHDNPEWSRNINKKAWEASARAIEASKEEMVCTICGKKYMGVPAMVKGGYCGRNCQATARRRRNRV